jgi:hypothetical protein
VILRTTLALQVAATLAGALLLYSGVTAVLRLIPPPAERAPASRAGRVLAVPLAAVVLVIAADAAFFAAGGAASTNDGSTHATAPRRCATDRWTRS